MKKSIIAFSLGLALLLPVTSVQALSCLPVADYLETVVGDETTQVFIGTATAVENHTQVVKVTEALQGYVAPEVWVQHQYSTDWQYFCSNGPAAAGKSTIFLTTPNEYGARMVTQTIEVDSDSGKDFIAKFTAAEIEAGITEATEEERVMEIKQSIADLLKVVINLLQELRYWQS
jgi:hypothetical protein